MSGPFPVRVVMVTKGGRKDKDAPTLKDVQRRQRTTLFALLGAIILVFAGLVWADRAGVFTAGGGDPCASIEGGQIVHEHARLFLYLDSQAPFDFSPSKYQVQAGFIHFEHGQADANGATIHIHQVRPTLRCLLTTVHFRVHPDATVVTDTGTRFDSDDYDISITMNGNPVRRGWDEPILGCDNPCNTYVIRYTPKGETPPPDDTGNDTTDGHDHEHEDDAPGNGTRRLRR